MEKLFKMEPIRIEGLEHSERRSGEHWNKINSEGFSSPVLPGKTPLIIGSTKQGTVSLVDEIMMKNKSFVINPNQPVETSPSKLLVSMQAIGDLVSHKDEIKAFINKFNTTSNGTITRITDEQIRSYQAIDTFAVIARWNKFKDLEPKEKPLEKLSDEQIRSLIEEADKKLFGEEGSMEKWIENGSLISDIDQDEIVGIILSTPIATTLRGAEVYTLEAKESTFKMDKTKENLSMGYSNYLCVHSSFRKRALCISLIDALRIEGFKRGLKAGYHMLPKPMTNKDKQIEIWLRPINIQKCEKLEFVPSIEKNRGGSRATTTRKLKWNTKLLQDWTYTLISADDLQKPEQPKEEESSQRTEHSISEESTQASLTKEEESFSLLQKLNQGQEFVYNPTVESWRSMIKAFPSYLIKFKGVSVGIVILQHLEIFVQNKNTVSNVSWVSLFKAEKDLSKECLKVVIHICSTLNKDLVYGCADGYREAMSYNNVVMTDMKRFLGFYNLDWDKGSNLFSSLTF